MKTSSALLVEAVAALLRGDTAERDRLCRIADFALRREQRVREGGPLFTEEQIELVNGTDGVYRQKDR